MAQLAYNPEDGSYFDLGQLVIVELPDDLSSVDELEELLDRDQIIDSEETETLTVPIWRKSDDKLASTPS